MKKAKTFKEELDAIRQQAGEAMAKVHDHLAKCPHEKLEQKTYYFDGSYDNLAYTDYWDECVICKKKFNERTQTHSWYG